jgi:hypothetical protein
MVAFDTLMIAYAERQDQFCYCYVMYGKVRRNPFGEEFCFIAHAINLDSAGDGD